MNSIAEFLANPLLWKIIITYWAFSSLVGALPELTPTSKPVYAFVYRFLHGFAGNIRQAAVRFNVPGQQ